MLPALLLAIQTVISVRTELVVVPVVVTDARGHHVPGLTQANFRVLEDGRPQPISAFHHGGMPITLGVIVDRSQSMGLKTVALRAAVSALLASSRRGDELFGVTFNDGVSAALTGNSPFTDNANDLAMALAAVRAEGRTALYDGVAEGLRRLELAHSPTSALIVISDGGDNASRHTAAQVAELARRSKAAIYAIGLLGTPPTEEEEDPRVLKRLCRDSGGVAYFPATIAEVAAVSNQISLDLHDQYLLGFTPGPRTVGGRPSRAINVKVSADGQGRLQVRARSDYVVAVERK